MTGSPFSATVSRQPIETPRFGLNIATGAEAVDAAIACAVREKGFTFYTLNLDHVAKLRRNAAFRDAYRRADYVCADGWPIVWFANRAAGRQVYERVAGADMIEPLMQTAAQRGLPVYLIGPSQKAQVAAISALLRRIPGLIVAGAEAPEINLEASDFDPLAMAARLRAGGARLCLVALGAPKQELFAAKLAAHCPTVGFLCVGAALDFIAGSARRAPPWMRRGGLEWLWRLAAEPRRLAPRYVASAYALLLLALGVEIVPAGERR